MKRAAFVTGGASGIGLSIGEHLARAGHGVAIADYNGDAAEAAAAAIRDGGGRAIAVQVDVSDRSQVDKAVEAARGELGPVGILVTSAAVSRAERFEEMAAESWEQIIAVNLTGTFHCVQAVIEDMTEAGWGRVVMISSSSAQRGSPRMTHYAASKGGVIAFGKALALEFAARGVTVNNIAPSVIETPMVEQMRAAGKVGSSDAMARGVPVGRMGTGDDIAAACMYLVSEEASYITGQTVSVNGGSFVGW
ncbi:MAG TPA: SDR family NAD(P)-dependent oxidoreductase [Trebonia sp.]|nr:SDR family NAD(P)-dependent oxidoreductase [Trebonia sp.]